MAVKDKIIDLFKDVPRDRDMMNERFQNQKDADLRTKGSAK